MPTFELAHPADRDALITMRVELYTHENSPVHPQSDAALDTLLATPSLGRAFLIRDDGLTVGYLILIYSFSIEHAGPTALLDELYITSTARGKGHGKAAVQFAIDAARDAGCKILYLEVSNENHPARQLYTNSGFKPLPRSYFVRPL